MRSLTARASDDVADRVKARAERAGVSVAAWCLEAIVWALERDESAVVHVPVAIADARPSARLVTTRVRFEPRIVRDRW